jgi:excisionase family DNA binding protein
MENVFLTSLTTPEVRELFRKELEFFFETNNQITANTVNTQPPITTKQLCQFLGITEPTVIRWRKKGKIPYIQIGSALRYDKEAVLLALSENKKGGIK